MITSQNDKSASTRLK